MSLDFVIVQVESQTRHFFCQRFLELWAFLICKDVRIINSPASHRLASDLRGEIPYVARDVIGDREELEIAGCPAPNTPLHPTVEGAVVIELTGTAIS